MGTSPESRSAARDADEALARRIHADEPGAIDQFFADCWGSAVRYAASLCKDRAQAEDLASEAFLRTWEAMRRGTTPRNLLSYLLQAVRNLYIDQARRSNRITDADPIEESDARIGAHVPDFTMLLTERDCLTTALTSLNPRQRAMLWDTVVEGYSTTEAAERLDLVTPNAGAQLAHRARASLRRAYADASS